MDTKEAISRRQFLRMSAVAASTMLAACNGASTSSQGGGATDTPAGAGTAGNAPIAGATAVALAAPSTFNEAPTLAALVKAGKLPPVAQRLPQHPYVVPHKWLTPGKYGGSMQWSTANTWGVSHFMQESMYGHSPLRFLQDGLALGPGLAERWESTPDARQWTFHFRQGLKWSDGQPFTTADIMYWWDDMVNNHEYTDEANLPDDFRSGTGKAAQFKAIDEQTLQITYDVAAPLVADLAACWVKCGIGPRWLAPKHYLQQFHPKYNKDVKDYKAHTLKMDFTTNPDCPVLTGWRMIQYKEGQQTIWERNPYYWCVDKAGNQLPYLDRVVVAGYQDQQAEKVNIFAGKVDYVHGGFGSVGLQDIEELKRAQSQSKLEVLLWDSGSGTGSIFFLNYDYKDEKLRTLFREPKFRKAISFAFNRAQVQRVVYFNTGELTTGTYSPKSIEYLINDQGKQVYKQWRDSAVAYDPTMAKKLLDEIGVKAGADGVRTMPDGSPLKIELDFQAPGDPEHIHKNEFLAADLKAVGINAILNPLPPTGFATQWAAGAIMSKTDWEASDGPNHLDNPTWLVPMESTRWAPLEGMFYSVRGTPKETAEKDVNPYERQPPRLEATPGGPIEQMWKLYDQAKLEPDAMKRNKLVWDIIKIHVDSGPFYMGVVANNPKIVLVKAGLKNVPRREDLALNGYVNTWIHPTPSAYDPEAYYWENPEQHV
ncbi:MAG: ABC transporter substrate-binding protein [Herpetosiphonaceae bacterium]|nr:ABC transporter substrate-binding protein [Herpetosiphonaceae bacterium]